MSGDNKKKCIEEIREEFGIGIIDEKSLNAINNYKRKLDNALKLLSEQLYSEKNHFIMELIQNADDNEYQANNIPYLKFIYDNEQIVIKNNEIGFNKENVKALCGVGESTKSNKEGFTGEKGIGFKSVFIITDEPEIYSNGYFFKFYRKYENELGYIVPHWIEIIPNIVEKEITNIILPVKESEKKNIIKFEDIKPEMLMFLRKLKIIELFDNILNNKKSFKYYDKSMDGSLDDNEIKIFNCDNIQTWKFFKSSKEIPENYQDESRKYLPHKISIEEYENIVDSIDIESDINIINDYFKKNNNFMILEKEISKEIQERIRKILVDNGYKFYSEFILAFPINEKKDFKEIDDLYIYAFLPVKKENFMFLIQANFILSTNREDIDKKRLWNEWHRDMIAEVFLESLEMFKNDDKLKYSYYNYISLPSDISDEFFKEVSSQIIELIKGKESILTENNKWEKPENLFFYDDELIKIISNKDLIRYFNKQYINHSNNFDKRLFKEFEVKDFDNKYLIEILDQKEWLESKDDEWFIKLYAFLNKKEIFNIKDKYIFLLQNDELTSLKDGNIFYPLINETSYEFEKKIRIIKHSLYEKISENENAKLFIEKMGLLKPDVSEIIEKHILPDYEKNVKEKNDEILYEYIKYIKINYSSLSSEIQIKLKDSIKLKTKGDGDYRIPSYLYLSKEYFNDYSLEELLSDKENYFVSEYYLKDILKDTEEELSKLRRTIKKKGQSKQAFKKYIEDKKKEIKGKEKEKILEWKKFFNKIDISVKIKIKKDKNTIKNGNNLSSSQRIIQQNSIWENEIFEDSYESGIYYIENDYKSEDFLCIIKNFDKDDNNWNNYVFHIISSDWNYYSRFIKCVYYYRLNRANSWYAKDTKSTFLINLINSKWIPTTKGIQKPIETYLDSEEIREILGDDVPYLIDSNYNPDMIDKIGINKVIEVPQLLKHLIWLRDNGIKDKERYQKIYILLLKRWTYNYSEQIKNTFSSEKLIFIEDDFYKTSEVFWMDNFYCFKDKVHNLINYYRSLKEFFINEERLDIKDNPNLIDYISLLKNYIEKKELNEDDYNIIKNIYKAFRNFSENEREDSEELFNDYIGVKFIWTNKREFKSVKNNLYVNNDEYVYNLFNDNPDVSFFFIDKDEYPSYKDFIEIFNIPYVKDEIKINLINSNECIKNNQLEKNIQDNILYITRYIYTKYPKKYSSIKESKSFDEFCSIRCYSNDILKTEFILDNAKINSECEILLKENNLYMKTDIIKNIDKISNELAKYFDLDIEDFISNLLNKLTDNEKKALLEIRGIAELPKDEIKWIENIIDSQEIGSSDEGNNENNESDLINSDINNLENQSYQKIEDKDLNKNNIEEDSKTEEQYDNNEEKNNEDEIAIEKRETKNLNRRNDENNIDNNKENSDHKNRENNSNQNDEKDQHSKSYKDENPDIDKDYNKNRDDNKTDKGNNHHNYINKNISSTDSTPKPTTEKSKEDMIRKNIENLRSISVSPKEIEDESDEESKSNKRDDKKYRNAVIVFERKEGRYPKEMSELNKGYDIDSFNLPENAQDRLLIRRIEIKGKGKGRKWEDEEIVELSDAQYMEALNFKNNRESKTVDSDFYLYIVEEIDETNFRIMIIRNPAVKSKKYILRAGIWRYNEMLDKNVEISIIGETENVWDEIINLISEDEDYNYAIPLINKLKENNIKPPKIENVVKNMDDIELLFYWEDKKIALVSKSIIEDEINGVKLIKIPDKIDDDFLNIFDFNYNTRLIKED